MDLKEYMKLPFVEGIKALIEKEDILADTWQELAARYSKGNVFGLIKAANLYQTKVVRTALQTAMEMGIKGKVFDDFVMKEIKGATRGYTENVFRTNLSTAVHGGMDRQAKRFRSFIVGFEFMSTGGEHKTSLGTGWGDGSTRENHAKADGLRASQDSPIWSLFWPPLGYRCRCTIRHITKTEAENKGWLDDSGQLKTYHPKIFEPVTVNKIIGHGAHPDQGFGRRPA